MLVVLSLMCMISTVVAEDEQGKPVPDLPDAGDTKDEVAPPVKLPIVSTTQI